MNFFQYITAILLVVFSNIACTEAPPPLLGPKDIKLVDSLYQLEVVQLKPVLDSICDSRYDSILQQAVDSMLSQRLEEIERQLERFRKERQ